MVFLSDGYRENAVYANQVVIDYLADETHMGSTGVIFMDFAGVDESKSYNGETVYEVKGLKLLDAVIAQNFRQSTGIIEARKASERADDSWYTLDGRQVSGQPKARGIYLHQGRKILK
jgi:hypothetical protein